MKQLTIQSLGFLIGFQEDIKVPRLLGTINHTVIRVSYMVSRRYQNPPGPIEQLITIYHTVIRVSYRISKRCQNPLAP